MVSFGMEASFSAKLPSPVHSCMTDGDTQILQLHSILPAAVQLCPYKDRTAELFCHLPSLVNKMLTHLTLGLLRF